MKTNIILAWALLLMGSPALFAQDITADDVSTIPVYVEMPESWDGISLSHASKIEDRVNSLINAQGISGTGYVKTFAVQPQFQIYDEKKVEGMRTQTVIDAEVVLSVKNMINGTIYATYTRRLAGSGTSRDQAINNAIRSLPVKDAQVSAFFTDAKKEILAYYIKRCPDILAKADALVASQEYASAIAVLMQVPEEAQGCYTEALDKSVVAFKAYQEQNCKEVLQKAKAAGANNDYAVALANLSTIDPSAPCAGEAETLLRDMAKRVDAEEKRDWDFMVKQWDDVVDLEKHRITAIKDLAAAIYNTRPQTVHSNTFYGF